MGSVCTLFVSGYCARYMCGCVLCLNNFLVRECVPLCCVCSLRSLCVHAFCVLCVCVCCVFFYAFTPKYVISLITFVACVYFLAVFAFVCVFLCVSFCVPVFVCASM